MRPLRGSVGSATRRGAWRRAAGALALALVATVAASVGGGSPVQAHNLDMCGDGGTIKWSGKSTDFYYPSTWGSLYKNGITAAQSSFNTSDFDYYYASVTSALVIWNNYNSSDTSIAGVGIPSMNCSTHTIVAGSLYYNFPHYGTSHTQDQYTCTAIHEMGHVAGFAHNSVVNSSGNPASILYSGHSTRCHNSLIKTLQSHDTSDINGRY